MLSVLRGSDPGTFRRPPYVTDHFGGHLKFAHSTQPTKTRRPANLLLPRVLFQKQHLCVLEISGRVINGVRHSNAQPWQSPARRFESAALFRRPFFSFFFSSASLGDLIFTMSNNLSDRAQGAISANLFHLSTAVACCPNPPD